MCVNVHASFCRQLRPTGGPHLIAALNFSPTQEVGSSARVYTHTHTHTSRSVADSQWIFVGDTVAARLFTA